MFGTKARSIVTKGLLALALAGSLTVAGTRPAAASMTDASMGCGVGTETVTFGFPQEGAGRMSVFAYSINGGAWKFTNWYYTANGFAWMWNGSSWIGLPGGIASFALAGSNNKIVGYEYRYDPSARTGRWIALGSCTTSSFFNDGLVYTYNH